MQFIFFCLMNLSWSLLLSDSAVLKSSFIPKHVTDLLPMKLISCTKLLYFFLFNTTYFSILLLPLSQLLWDVLPPSNSKCKIHKTMPFLCIHTTGKHCLSVGYERAVCWGLDCTTRAYDFICALQSIQSWGNLIGYKGATKEEQAKQLKEYKARCWL